MKKTETIYNKNADFWSRNKPLSLSDFTARNYLFKYLGKLNNLKIADIGCGEGYCSREFIKFGAKHIIGVDSSKSMIQNANKNVFKSQNETFIHADLKRNIPKEIFKCDIICAIFLFNYIDNNNMQKIFNQIALKKKKKTRFIFTLPHPIFPFIYKKKFPFSFTNNSKDYFDSSNKCFDGKIYRIDDVILPIKMYHRTFEKIFEIIRSAGFNRIIHFKELGVNKSLINKNKKFFGPLQGIPLHILIEV